MCHCVSVCAHHSTIGTIAAMCIMANSSNVLVCHCVSVCAHHSTIATIAVMCIIAYSSNV